MFCWLLSLELVGLDPLRPPEVEGRVWSSLLLVLRPSCPPASFPSFLFANVGKALSCGIIFGLLAASCIFAFSFAFHSSIALIFGSCGCGWP